MRYKGDDETRMRIQYAEINADETRRMYAYYAIRNALSILLYPHHLYIITERL